MIIRNNLIPQTINESEWMNEYFQVQGDAASHKVDKKVE